ncbi:hypothetical protein PR048_013672 [Dryococelus australis]|uniref:Uncharacterized protein n=1 Tax=Dryococelus australis TaxID=614101 RepID=A0ABQ9HSW0_9NEOP|nr:hypothetical protein PR048_013672 [Dryococelus australis]
MMQHCEICQCMYVIPAAATETSPAELLMGHRLRICLDKVHPHIAEEMKQKQRGQQGSIYIKTMGQEPKWVPDTIVEVTGPLSYKLITNDGVEINKVACGPVTAQGMSYPKKTGEVRGRQELQPPSPVEEAEFSGFAPSVPTLRGQTSSSQCWSDTDESSEAKPLACTRSAREPSKPS